jgi:hypothetical protein
MMISAEYQRPHAGRKLVRGVKRFAALKAQVYIAIVTGGFDEGPLRDPAS